MQILWISLWGLFGAFACIAANRWVVPYMKSRESASQTENYSSPEMRSGKPISEEQAEDQNRAFKALSQEKMNITTRWNHQKTIITIIYCAIGCICGRILFSKAETISMIGLLWAFCVLGIAAWTDCFTMRIPNLIPLSMVIGRIVLIGPELLLQGDSWKSILKCAIGAALVLLFLGMVSLVTRGGIGAGDIKLLAAQAFLCGISNSVCTLLIACLLSAAVSAFLLIFHKKELHDVLPMAPFVLTGFFIACLIGAY